MSTLRQKMRSIRSIAQVFEEAAPYDHFGNNEKGGLKHIPSAPRYVMRALAQLEYAYRLCKAGDVEGSAVEPAADIALQELQAYGALTPDGAKRVEEALLPLRDAARKYTVHMVAHAHIDMNWMWPWHETVAVTLETFRTMLKLMEEYPQFTFSQSQASVYRIVEEFEPEMLEKIKQYVHQGRWEVTASTWVEADKNMPNLESMAHHLMLTKEYLSKLLDIDPATLNLDYEPDTFGHSENVPEILNKGGVKYMYHCRGYEDHAIYNWQAPSGASVLAVRDHTWYLAHVSPGFAQHVPEFCKRYGITEYLRVYGVGDHGGGPTRQDLSYILEMQSWPVFPTIKFSTYKAFYDYLYERKEQFPVVRQELNPVFTGCYTTQSRIKMSNRIGEAVTSEAQALSAAAQQLTGRKPNAAALDESWKKVLFNQFHDIIPGSGVRDTREFAMTKFSEVMALSGTEYTAAMRAIAENIDTSSIIVRGDISMNQAEGAGVGYGSMQYRMPVAERGGALTRIFHLFNPAPQDRTQNVLITVWDWAGDLNAIEFKDMQGNVLPCQLLTPQPKESYIHKYVELLVHVTVPAHGYTTIVMDEKETDDALRLPTDPRVERPDGAYVLENDLICAVFDPMTAQMVSLKDKASGRELIGAPAGFRFIVEDTDKGMTSWVVGRYKQRRALTEDVRIRNVFSGTLRSGFDVEMPFGKSSSLTAHVSLDKGARHVRYEVKAAFGEVGDANGIPQLAFAAPLSYESKEALYDIPAGSIVRKAVKQDLPANTFMTALDAAGGKPLTLSTDSKYGFRCDENEAQVTLVRGAFDPDPYSDRGDHQFVINVHAEQTVCAMGLARMVHDAVRPVHVLSGGRHEGTLPAECSFVKLGFGDIQLSCVKPAQDGCGVVLHLYDIVGKGGTAKLTFAKASKRVVLTDLLEQEIAGDVYVAEEKVEIVVAPHTVVGVKVTF